MTITVVGPDGTTWSLDRLEADTVLEIADSSPPARREPAVTRSSSTSRTGSYRWSPRSTQFEPRRRSTTRAEPHRDIASRYRALCRSMADDRPEAAAVRCSISAASCTAGWTEMKAGSRSFARSSSRRSYSRCEPGGSPVDRVGAAARAVGTARRRTGLSRGARVSRLRPGTTYGSTRRSGPRRVSARRGVHGLGAARRERARLRSRGERRSSKPHRRTST